jgi:gamma-glutamylcyclotransferase (GGCT)/AIG2-like uncharacterized protein YtfP
MSRLAGSSRLFVYGTLRAGQTAHEMLATATFLGHRTAPGFRVDTSGEYPTLVPDDGAAAGELYEVDDATLAAIDDYEGASYERFAISLDDGTTAIAYRRT